MSKRQIFLVFDCDEWKSTASMRLALATTSPRRVKSFISSLIEKGEFLYSCPYLTEKKKAAAFRKDWDKTPRDEINDRLTFCFFDYVYDGEEY